MAGPRSRRIALLIASIGVAAICVRLGIWQLDRLDERRARNDEIEIGLAAPPAPAVAVLAGPAADAAYRRVESSGTYLAEGELLLYGRPLDGRPGDHVLTPLVLEDGTVLVVDRGWVPFDADRPAPTVGAEAAPTGEVAVSGVLLPSEEGEAFPTGDTAEASTVHAVAIPALSEHTGRPLAPLYLLLDAQEPSQSGGLPEPAPLPAREEGPHMSYAIQWFSFALIALVGYGVLARRDRRRSAEATTGEDPS